MLRKRIIPVILLDGYSVVKTIQFHTRRNLGNPIAVARIYNSRNIDELVLLDIDAAKDKRQIDYFTIQDIASECFMPLTVGGGLENCKSIEKALKKGADKVVLNTEALKHPAFISEAAAEFGSQCVIISVDVKLGAKDYEVYSHSGLEKLPALNDWCRQIEELGAGEIFLNSVDRDGLMSGYDLDLVRRVSDLVKIPVIACGGAGEPEDTRKAISSGASAAAAASLFHFTSFTPEDCRAALRGSFIPVR